MAAKTQTDRSPRDVAERVRTAVAALPTKPVFAGSPEDAQRDADEAGVVEELARGRVVVLHDQWTAATQQRTNLGDDRRSLETEAADLDASLRIGEHDPDARERLDQLRQRLAEDDPSGKRRELRDLIASLEKSLQEACLQYIPLRTHAKVLRKHALASRVPEHEAAVAEAQARLDSLLGRIRSTSASGAADNLFANAVREGGQSLDTNAQKMRDGVI